MDEMIEGMNVQNWGQICLSNKEYSCVWSEVVKKREVSCGSSRKPKKKKKEIRENHKAVRVRVVGNGELSI